MGVGLNFPEILTLCWNRMLLTLLCKSHCIGEKFINLICGSCVKITPDINPIYVGSERS